MMREEHGGGFRRLDFFPIHQHRLMVRRARGFVTDGDIEEIWHDCGARFGKGGKFLFEKFGNADAMFAPVVTRLDTFDIKVAPETRAYMDHVLATPAFKAWKDAALKETWIIAADEVD